MPADRPVETIGRDELITALAAARAECEAWQDAVQAGFSAGWPGDCGACADDEGPEHVHEPLPVMVARDLRRLREQAEAAHGDWMQTAQEWEAHVVQADQERDEARAEAARLRAVLRAYQAAHPGHESAPCLCRACVPVGE